MQETSRKWDPHVSLSLRFTPFRKTFRLLSGRPNIPRCPPEPAQFGQKIEPAKWNSSGFYIHTPAYAVQYHLNFNMLLTLPGPENYHVFLRRLLAAGLPSLGSIQCTGRLHPRTRPSRSRTTTIQPGSSPCGRNRTAWDDWFSCSPPLVDHRP